MTVTVQRASHLANKLTRLRDTDYEEIVNGRCVLAENIKAILRDIRRQKKSLATFEKSQKAESFEKSEIARRKIQELFRSLENQAEMADRIVSQAEIRTELKRRKACAVRTKKRKKNGKFFSHFRKTRGRKTPYTGMPRKNLILAAVMLGGMSLAPWQQPAPLAYQTHWPPGWAAFVVEIIP